jgi:hypothetical protein
MKKLLLLGLVLMQSVFAYEYDTKVVVRDQRHRARTEVVTLEDLETTDSFDGKYFKIVVGKGDEAVKFEDEERIVFKAATVYYHLTKARNYFVNRIGSAYVKSLPKMLIRIEHFNSFSPLARFTHDNYGPMYNNALTIPAGKGLARHGIKPWGMEIWFRPVKPIHISEITVHQDGAAQMKGMMKGVRKQIHMQSFSMLLAQGITAFSKGGAPLSVSNFLRTGGASLMIEAFYQFSDPLSKLFQRRWYEMDSALIPEVIHHEYSHAALSDFLELERSTAVIEGMADFFAGQIGSTKTLAKKIKKYSTYAGKKAKDDKQYQLLYEHKDYANSDFVFGILNQLKDIIGPSTGAPFIFYLRRNITTNSMIRNEFIEGILKTCEQRCQNPAIDKLKILKMLNERKI